MREELVNQLMQRVGLDRQMAEQCADVALSVVKERVPEPLRSMLGEQAGSSSPGGLGGLFGKQP
jgi:hypothetical protein